MISPKALIIAGPNGSGKSTLQKNLQRFGISFPDAYINPDEIALRLQVEMPQAASDEILRLAFDRGRELRQKYREKGLSFALETVFSHPSGIIDLSKLHDMGYEVNLIVVTTSSSDINVHRVRERVKTGGHTVDETKIRERYTRFMALLPRIVEMANTIKVFDASDETRLCYLREQFVVELGVPEYLKTALLEPLERRKQSRSLLEKQVLQKGALKSLNEEAGEYEGIVMSRTECHLLQEVELGQYILHDALLLDRMPDTGEKIRCIYKDGCGQVTPMTPKF